MLAEIIWNRDTIALVCVFSVPIVAIIGGIWLQMERQRSDSELKRTMIEQGRSADDIERVLSAKVSKH
jgi:hypothetical protein